MVHRRKVRTKIATSGDRVTIVTNKVCAAQLLLLLGMTGGRPDCREVFEALFEYFDVASIPFLNWERFATMHGTHNPFINQYGVISFGPKGEFGLHNTPHFPCGSFDGDRRQRRR